MPEQALLELARAHAGPGVFPDLASLRRKLRYVDFEGFIAAFVFCCRQLRCADDFRFAAEALARELTRQGVRYAEVCFSPGDFPGQELGDIALAIRSGFDAAASPRVRLIVDLIRDLGPEAGLRRVEESSELAAEADIVAIGLGGRESAYPASAYRDCYRRAHALGLRRVVHAGETLGPESVRDALDELEPDRIGHGVHSARDAVLLSRLARERRPLEVCPGSNLGTGAVADLSQHPLPALVAAGVPVTLSTDDPTLFRTDLASEYRRARSLGLDDEALVRIARTGFEVAFLPDAERAALLAEFDDAARHIRE